MKASPVKISAIMATFNRADYVGRSLATILSQTLDPGDYEVIVVDNNSRDNTAEVVRRLQASYRNLHYVFEETSGLSYARNRGIEEARGPIICFVDDDIVADKAYLENMLAAFHAHPEVESVGGKVLAMSVEPVHPYWNGFPYLVTTTDFGDKPFYFTDAKHGFPLGVSMAFRREVFDKYGLFNTEFGRKSDRLMVHEELDLFERILTTPRNCLYEPKALLYHIVMPERMNLLYVMRWHFWYGVSDGMLHGMRYAQDPMREWIINRRPGLGDFRPLRSAFTLIRFSKLLHSIYLVGFFWTKFKTCRGISEHKRNGSR